MALLALPVPRKFSSPFRGNGYRYGIKVCASGTVFNGMRCIQGFMKIYQFVETILGINQYTRTLNKDGGLSHIRNQGRGWSSYIQCGLVTLLFRERRKSIRMICLGNRVSTCCVTHLLISDRHSYVQKQKLLSEWWERLITGKQISHTFLMSFLLSFISRFYPLFIY
jgi:hypothetical protein